VQCESPHLTVPWNLLEILLTYLRYNNLQPDIQRIFRFVYIYRRLIKHKFSLYQMPAITCVLITRFKRIANYEQKPNMIVP